LFFLNRKELEPVLETVKSPIVPDPVTPPENSELDDPDIESSVIKNPLLGPCPVIAG
jgi:hypothetical protein